jgi:hypothetical protein
MISMMKCLKARLLVVPLVSAIVLTATAAHAATGSFASLVGNTSFSNDYFFTITSNSNFTGSALSASITNFAASLNGTPLPDTSP